MLALQYKIRNDLLQDLLEVEAGKSARSEAVSREECPD